MFKKLLSLFALGALVPISAQAQLNVFTCEPEWAQLAKELGGDKVKTYSATHASQDPHYIQARPSLIAKARRADLLVCTGADLEVGWLPVLLERSANSQIQVGAKGHFLAANHVVLLEKLDYVDHSMGHVHAAGNPHFQTDPRRMLEVAKALTNRLIALDPNQASHYQKLGLTFVENMNKALIQWQQQAKAIQQMPIVVHHHSWVYFNDWLGLNQVATLEPKPGIPPSTSHLSQLMQKLKSEPAKVIIYAAYQNPKAAHWLAQKTGIPVLKLHSSLVPEQTLITFYQSLLDRLLKINQGYSQ